MSDDRSNDTQESGRSKWRPSVRTQIWIVAGAFFLINAVLLAVWAIALALNTDL